MRTIEVKLLSFDELSEDAKEKAREWYRDGNSLDWEWWDYIYYDAKRMASLMGIEIENIYFSGFCSQGDGACFEGSYSYAKGGLAAVTAECGGNDPELIRIASELQAEQRTAFYQLEAGVKHSGHYYHEMCTRISVSRYDDYGHDTCTDEQDEAISGLLRDFMRWIYSQLEAEYEHMMSDEAVDEMLRINEYEFTEDGEIA